METCPSGNYQYAGRCCRKCSKDSHHVTVSPCSPDSDAQCRCTSGFYCSDPACEHCLPLSVCLPGEGATKQGTGDVICEACKEGTYNNLTDSQSPCLSHSNCTALGQMLKIPGTNISDSVCIPKTPTGCDWLLPAGLWVGFALFTVIIFILLGFVYRKMKHQQLQYKGVQNLVPHCPSPPFPASMPSLSVYRCGEAGVAVSGVPRLPSLSDQKLPVMSSHSPTTLFSNFLRHDAVQPPSSPTETCDPSVTFYPLETCDLEADGATLLTLRTCERLGLPTNYPTGSALHSEPQEDEWTDPC
ncbi:tumor necrosis factor receptor superfamily member 3 isoform X2 [Amia ocellicauda]|uniref:tumor necrosis factor receptor superfamily member 3 isoform X2 n=1 Tax=Amia ocellicauda TaxID=2972642 RepID=UPI003463C462